MPCKIGGRGRGSKASREYRETVSLHIDELAMVKRPQVNPTSTDVEVFVDPLPDESDMESWLAAFMFDMLFKNIDFSTCQHLNLDMCLGTVSACPKIHIWENI